MKLSTLGLRCAALVAGLGLLSVARSGAQAKGSLSDSEIEKNELKVTIEKVLVENQQLSSALAETQKTLVDMRKNLAATNAETEVFKRRAMELTLKFEALGLDAATGNSAKLEQRLLAAVSDMRLMSEENKKLSEAIIRLSEASSFFAKTTTGASPEARGGLEAEIRNANLALGLNSPNAVEAEPIAATISDGSVISVKDDLGLVVMNLGTTHGVKVGMPFQVTRDNQIVGTVRVVDVRTKFAGAYILNLSSEKDRIKIGDHLKVDARK